MSVEDEGAVKPKRLPNKAANAEAVSLYLQQTSSTNGLVFLLKTQSDSYDVKYVGYHVYGA